MIGLLFVKCRSYVRPCEVVNQRTYHQFNGRTCKSPYTERLMLAICPINACEEPPTVCISTPSLKFLMIFSTPNWRNAHLRGVSSQSPTDAKEDHERRLYVLLIRSRRHSDRHGEQKNASTWSTAPSKRSQDQPPLDSVLDFSMWVWRVRADAIVTSWQIALQYKAQRKKKEFLRVRFQVCRGGACQGTMTDHFHDTPWPTPGCDGRIDGW